MAYIIIHVVYLNCQSVNHHDLDHDQLTINLTLNIIENLTIKITCVFQNVRQHEYSFRSWETITQELIIQKLKEQLVLNEFLQ